MGLKLKHVLPFFQHTWIITKTGNIISLAEKVLKKENGTFTPHAFVHLPLGFSRIQKFLFVACPQMSREILHHHANSKSRSQKFDRGWIADIFRSELGDTLFTVEAAKHDQLRSFISQFFRQSLDKRFGANLCARTHDLLEKWLKYEGRPIDVNHYVPFFTARAIIDNFIGELDDPMRLHEAMDLILRNMERQFRLKRPFPKKKMQEAQQIVRDSAAEVNRKEPVHPTLLSMMSAAKNEAGDPLFSGEDIEAMARFLFLAGQETVASILPAMIHHCTEEFQQKICEEWDQEQLDIHSTEDIVKFSKKSKWVQAVINESLRLFPPAHVSFRMNCEDMEMNGTFIPKGTGLLLFTLFFQRDPQFWGSDADQFNPQRWIAHTMQEGSLPFLPFGMGPNHCLGQPFSRLEMGIFLTLLCLKTRWKALTPSYELYPRFSLSTKENVMISMKPL